MKNLGWVLALAICCAIGVTAVAQTPDAKKPEAKKPDAKAAAGDKGAAAMDPEMAKQMESWMKAATPADGHAKMAPMVGKWTYVTKWRMTPEAPWEESTGKAEFKWALGNRFLMGEVKGNPSPNDAMMGGAPFEGIAMYGYDNMTKKYVNTWMDNMSTGTMISHGTADGSGKTFTFQAEEGMCPMTGQMKAPKSVLKIDGDNKLVFEMHEKGPDGKEFKCLEVTYTRAK